MATVRHNMWVVHSPTPEDKWRGLEKCSGTEHATLVFPSRREALAYIESTGLDQYFKPVQVVLTTPFVGDSLAAVLPFHWEEVYAPTATYTGAEQRAFDYFNDLREEGRYEELNTLLETADVRRLSDVQLLMPLTNACHCAAHIPAYAPYFERVKAEYERRGFSQERIGRILVGLTPKDTETNGQPT